MTANGNVLAIILFEYHKSNIMCLNQPGFLKLYACRYVAICVCMHQGYA